MDEDKVYRRIADLEGVVSKFQEKLNGFQGKYSNYDKNILDFSNQYKELSKKYDDLKEKHQKLSEEKEVKNKESSLMSSFVQDQLRELIGSYIDLNQDMKANQKLHQKNANELEKLKSDGAMMHNDSNKRLLKLEESDKLKIKEKMDISLTLSDHTDKLNKLFTHKENLSNQIEIHKNKMNNLDFDIKKHADDHEKKHQKHNLEFAGLMKQIQVISHTAELQSRAVHEKLSQKIDSLPKPVLESPCYMDVINKLNLDLQSKFEHFELDLGNSVLKSSNCEIQMRIFEKKLENIYLLLKKHELSK